MPSPRAEQTLMTAYDRRQWGKMAGAAGFYARQWPPQYETVLLALLNQSCALAVAQDLILSKDPKLAEPAREDGRPSRDSSSCCPRMCPPT